MHGRVFGFRPFICVILMLIILQHTGHSVKIVYRAATSEYKYMLFIL